MEIKGPNLTSSPQNQSQIKRDVKQFYNGQVLKAVVANLNTDKVLLELIEPKIAFKFEAQANANFSFKSGQVVSLQVVNLGPPLSLNVLGNTNTANNNENTINAALRIIIPKQTSMNQLVSNLHYISKLNPQLSNRYPSEIIELSRAVVQGLTTVDGVKTADGVKAALNSTGLFLEQQLQTVLLGKSSLPGDDTRVSLLRLAESIRTQINGTPLARAQTHTASKNSVSSSSPNMSHVSKNHYLSHANHHQAAKNQHFNSGDLNRVPSNLSSLQQTNSALNELLRNIENSLAKIQYNQLQHFVSDEQSKSNWFFDLPIRHNEGSDIFQFKFTKEHISEQNNKEDEWSVTLTFNLEKLGEISILVYLKKNKIGATVWAKKNDTYTLFKQYLPDLQQQMLKSGIEVSNLRCSKGEITQSDYAKSTNILNEKV